MDHLLNKNCLSLEICCQLVNPYSVLFRIQFKGDLVTAVPEVNQVDLETDVEFILLASDGLWDYMKRSV